MKLNPVQNNQASFGGLRVNKSSVYSACKQGGRKAGNKLNKTVVGFTPRPVSIWSSSGYVGMFFKSKEQEKEFQNVLDELKIVYSQSKEIDSFDGWDRQEWVNTGNLPV